MNGLYQIRKIEDVPDIIGLGFDTAIADFGQEDALIDAGLDILVQINPDWEVEKIVQEFNNYPSVIGFYLPDEPNMNPHLTPGVLKVTVDKIKAISSKPVFVCIANINHGRDYAEWRKCGADVLMANIYPFKADPGHCYRKAWEAGKWYGKLFRKAYGVWRMLEDLLRMKLAVRAAYPQGTVAVLQCFGGKENSGSDRKFYLPTAEELSCIINTWKHLGVNRFFSFAWESEIHYNIRENHWMCEVIEQETKKGGDNE